MNPTSDGCAVSWLYWPVRPSQVCGLLCVGSRFGCKQLAEQVREQNEQAPTQRERRNCQK